MNLDAVKINETYMQDWWFIILKCSKWMESQGMNHWSNYYKEQSLLKKLEHGEVYIEYDNNIPVGTVTLSLQEPDYYTDNRDGENGETINYVDKFPSSKRNDTKALYISTLGVIPEQQGKGLASKLLELAEKRAIELGCNVIRFDSRLAFTSVINFYLKRGYKQVAIMMDEGESYGLFEKEVIKI